MYPNFIYEIDYEKLVKYKFDYISLYHVYKFSQEDFAEHEELTESYNLINFQLGLKLSDKLLCTVGINNLLKLCWEMQMLQ